MADQFKLQQIATYSQESPAQSFQPINNEDITVSPTNYESGKFILSGGSPIQNLCPSGGSASMLVLMSDEPITITLGGTNVLANVTLVTYKGDAVSVEVTANPTNDATIVYAMVTA